MYERKNKRQRKQEGKNIDESMKERITAKKRKEKLKA